jgi:hypothetical protein
MYAKKANISISGIVGSDLYCYKSAYSKLENCGIFTVRLGNLSLGRKNNQAVDEGNYFSIPIHVLASELVAYLEGKIRGGRWIAVDGCLHHFQDRFLVSIHNKSGVRLLKPSTNLNFISAQSINLNHAQLVWACNEEDFFMSQLASSEAAESSERREVFM